jgi:uncharacterized membrane protein
MSQQNRAEPVGCLALVVAIAALAVAYATSAGRPSIASLVPGGSASPTPAGAPPSRSTFDGGEELRDELRRLREERMSARKERMLSVAAGFRDGDRREYHRLRLRNACRYTVAVALRYRDLDESWISRGWWEVQPGATTTTDAMTRDPVYYLYAENQSVGRTWDGRGTEGAVLLAIGDEKFDLLEGEPGLFREARTVAFARRDSGPQWSDPVATFECPVEETPPPGTTARPPSAEQGARQR